MGFGSKIKAIALAVGLVMVATMVRADFWSDTGANFKGVTLHGVTEATPPSNYLSRVLTKDFERKTGIKVEIETTSWDQMYDKAIRDMQAGTGIYDMIYIEQDIIYFYLMRDWLIDITQSLIDNPDLMAPNFKEKNFTSFADYFRGKNGDLYGVPMEAFIKLYLYRTDLFNDPEIKMAFRVKNGYDLAPAKTHKQYTTITDFFTQWGKDHQTKLWGSTAQAHTSHVSSWYEYFESILPSFGVYNWGLNADNNYAASVENGGAMNSDTAKRALKWWLHLRDMAPPESKESTWTEVATTFAAGRAAQGLIYGENAAWIATDTAQSEVVGKVGMALPPASESVMEDAKSGKGYIGYYDGGAFGLPVTSRHKEAALLFLQYIGQNEVQPRWALTAPRITHTETYKSCEIMGMDRMLGGYYTLLRDKGKLFAGAPPYPFHAQLRDATAPIFFQILTGKLEPEEGLDKMAAKAEKDLHTLGYRK
jgi:multiple sugar transport system substrate-binding protein